jgi:hypothetical protein
VGGGVHGPAVTLLYTVSVYRLTPGVVDDFSEPEEPVRPDDDGEVHLRYQRLRIGLAYGARWAN